MEAFPIRQGAHRFKLKAHIARQPQRFALPQHFNHPVKIGAWAADDF
jgi:hypothetical protein